MSLGYFKLKKLRLGRSYLRCRLVDICCLQVEHRVIRSLVVDRLVLVALRGVVVALRHFVFKLLVLEAWHRQKVLEEEVQED